MAGEFADKSAARQWVWDRLGADGVARFPFPPHGRIPNFVGAEVAALRLLDIEPWKSATAIKVNPDSPQRPLRAEALRRGITVFVPTPRLRGDLEFAILRELGHAPVPVATTVHDLQVVDSVPRDPTDQPLSVIATPTQTIRIKRPGAAPMGIDWTRLSAEDLQEMPVLAELKRMKTSNA
jgi:5-formyltetrahydrofolate cyclo-ligase